MKKLIIFGLIFLGMISGAFALTTDDAYLYYSLDNDNISSGNPLDLSGNGRDGTNTNMGTGLTGILYEAFNSSTTDNNIDTGIKINGFTDGAISIWFKSDGSTLGAGTGMLISDRAANTEYITCGIGQSVAGKMTCKFRDGGTNYFVTSTSDVDDNQWHHMVLNYGSSGVELFINNVSEDTDPYTGGWANNGNLQIGTMQQLGGYTYSGLVDEFGIWQRNLNSSEISELYNGNASCDPYKPATCEAAPPAGSLTFQNVTLDSVSNFNNSFYNNTPVQLDVQLNSTNNQTNATIYIYNSTGLMTSNQFITNSLSGSYNISFPYEGDFKFFIFAENNETNASSPTTGNYTIHYDISPPSINNSLPGSISSYSLGNLSSYVSCADIDTGTCVVEFQPQNQSFNVSENVTFLLNGNQTYVITAIDGAGNTVTDSGTLLVNPLQYFKFYDTARALFVQNYTFGSYSSSGEYVSIPVYDLGLGNQSLQFSKFGYTQNNFSFTFNTTSALNQTFNVSAITITIQVFDENSPSTQLKFNLSMNNVSNYTQYLNELNFSKYYNETLSGNLTLTAESAGYSMRKIFTELNPYTAVSHVIYLLADADSTPVIFRVLNLAQTQSIEDVVFTFSKEVSGTPTFLGQAKTDSQGFTYFNMDILDDYEITISKDGYVTQIINSIPGKSEYTILMEEEGSSTPFLFQDFTYSFTPSGDSVNSVPFNVSAYTFDEANLISSMRFTVTGDNTSFTDILTTSGGGTIQFTVTNASPQYLLNLTVMRDGNEYNFVKKLNYYPVSTSNSTVQKVAEELDGEENNENRVFMMIIIYVIAVVLGSLFSSTVGAVAGLLPITIFAIPSVGWLTPGVAALFYLITILGVLYFER